MENKNVPAITTGNFIEKTNQLSDSLVRTQGEIKTLITQVSNTTPPTVEGHWYKLGGTSKKDINAALNSISTITSGSIKLLGEAEAKQNTAINELRQLVQALFLAEAEIYQRVELQYSASNETAALTSDLEKKLERSSRQADDLNSAFSRLTEIYKKRALAQNQLRDELGRCKEDISSLKDKKFNINLINELKRKIETIETIVATVSKDVTSNKDRAESLFSRYTALKESFDKNSVDYASSLDSINKAYEGIKDTINQLDKQFHDEVHSFSQALISFEQKIDSSTDEKAKAAQDALSEHKSNIDAQILELVGKLAAAADELKAEVSARETAVEQTSLALRTEMDEKAKAAQDALTSLNQKIESSFTAIDNIINSIREAIHDESKARSIESNDIKEHLGSLKSETSQNFDSVHSSIENIIQEASSIKGDLHDACERITKIEHRNSKFFYSLPYKITIGAIAVSALILELLSIFGIL